MVNLNDIHPLSEFQRNAKQFIQKLQKSRKPLVLTVNGKAALVIQDAGAYQKLLDQLELDLSASTSKERRDKFARDGS